MTKHIPGTPTTTQLASMKVLAAATGPVRFSDMRAGTLAISGMVDAFWVQKQTIDGRSHYRLTDRGIRAIARASEGV